jgi:hypothetical protein
MNVKHWRRLHINGWTAEVSLGDDGHHRHRTHVSHMIPDDFKESTSELETAQMFADNRVPRPRAHVS